MPEALLDQQAEQAARPPAPAPRSPDALAAAGAAAAMQLAAWAALYVALEVLHLGYGFFDLSDIVVYLKYAARMAAGQVPYVDFLIEYPPLVVPLLALPGRPDVPQLYAVRFALEMTAVGAGAAALTALVALRGRGGMREALSTGAVFALCIPALGAIVGNRYDIAVALVFAACLLALARRNWEAAAAVLGLGFALKLMPLVLLPLVLVLAGSTRRALRSAATFTVTALAPFAVFTAYGPLGVTGVIVPFTYNLGRPLEIESLFATPLLLANQLGALPLKVADAFGGQVLVSPVADALAGASTWLTLAAFAGVYALVWVRRDELRAAPEVLAPAFLAIVLTFTLFGKALSPQYLIWLLPMAALLAARVRPPAWPLLAALVLTHVLFPANYISFTHLATMPVLVVAARNVLLCVVLGLSLREVWVLRAA